MAPRRRFFCHDRAAHQGDSCDALSIENLPPGRECHLPSFWGPLFQKAAAELDPSVHTCAHGNGVSQITIYCNKRIPRSVTDAATSAAVSARPTEATALADCSFQRRSPDADAPETSVSAILVLPNRTSNLPTKKALRAVNSDILSRCALRSSRLQGGKSRFVKLYMRTQESAADLVKAGSIMVEDTEYEVQEPYPRRKHRGVASKDRQPLSAAAANDVDRKLKAHARAATAATAANNAPRSSDWATVARGPAATRKDTPPMEQLCKEMTNLRQAIAILTEKVATLTAALHLNGHLADEPPRVARGAPASKAKAAATDRASNVRGADNGAPQSDAAEAAEAASDVDADADADAGADADANHDVPEDHTGSNGDPAGDANEDADADSGASHRNGDDADAQRTDVDDYVSESGYVIDTRKRVVQPLDQPRSSASAASEAQWKRSRKAKDWGLLTARLVKLKNIKAARYMRARSNWRRMTTYLLQVRPPAEPQAEPKTAPAPGSGAQPTGVRILRRPQSAANSRESSPRPSSLSALPLSPSRNRKAARATTSELQRSTAATTDELTTLLKRAPPAAPAAVRRLPK